MLHKAQNTKTIYIKNNTSPPLEKEWYGKTLESNSTKISKVCMMNEYEHLWFCTVKILDFLLEMKVFGQFESPLKIAS